MIVLTAGDVGEIGIVECGAVCVLKKWHGEGEGFLSQIKVEVLKLVQAPCDSENPFNERGDMISTI
jgi:hypothetical protein